MDFERIWIDAGKEVPPYHKDILAWSTLDNDYVLAILTESKGWFCQPLFGVSYHTKSGVSHWCILPKRLDEFTLGELIGDSGRD
jgi:hypothetical protein